MMWSEKHRPESISEMVGNEEPRAAIVSWLAKWRVGTKPILLVGPPGIGKTTMAFLLAERFGYDMIGLNASDVRSKSKINEILGPVLGNAGVTGRPPLIFIDEVDGIHGRSDYGGTSALADILKQPAVPMVLAANDDTSDKLRPIKKAVTTVQFRRVPPRLLRAHLERVIRRESGPGAPKKDGYGGGGQDAPGRLSYGLIIKAVSRSRGDMRSMINLAQSYSTGFNPQTESTADALTPERAVYAFFAAESVQDAADVLRRMQSDPREKIGAFYSSIVTSAGSPQNRSAGRVAQSARLLAVISEADVLYGRIMRTQNWRLLRYLDSVLLGMYPIVNGGGAAAARSGEHRGGGGKFAVKYARYNVPWPLLTRIRFDGASMRLLASRMGPLLHVSSSAFGSVYMPYMLRCMASGAIAAVVPASTKAGGGDPHADIIAKEAARLERR